MLSRNNQVACLEEELILSGYDLAIGPRRSPEFFDIEQLLSRKWPQSDAARELKSHFSKIWMAVDPLLPVEILSYIDHPFARDYAYLCPFCKTMITDSQGELLAHFIQSHGGNSHRDADILLEEVPRGHMSSLVTMQFCRNNIQRISKWMQICFIESPAMRVLLRTSNSTRSLFCRNKPDWVIPVLEFWDRDGLPANDLTKSAVSGVDSRDGSKGGLGSV
jgi:hypothetical protein